MRFSWDDQSINRFKDSAACTGFHKKLAEKIIPRLEPRGTLCDLGCGLGRLDLELAPHVAEITAADISERAVAVLNRDAKALGLCNLRAFVRDAETMTGSFDVLMFSFFVKPGIPDHRKLRCRRIIRIVNADNKSGFYPERHRYCDKETVPDVLEELNAQGTGFDLEFFSAEFGQPLKSRRDAEHFVLINAPGADAGEINDFLNENIIFTGRDDFPLYLPNRKELGIFIIDTGEGQGEIHEQR